MEFHLWALLFYIFFTQFDSVEAFHLNPISSSLVKSHTKTNFLEIGRQRHCNYYINKNKNIQEYRIKSIDCTSNDIHSSELSSLHTSNYENDVMKTLGWFISAVAFAGILSFTLGVNSAIEFASGYVLEQSLSIDNLFVFLVLFNYFKVSGKNQEKILTYGLWGAIVLRAIFISLGAIVLTNFHQVLLFFAAILLVSSYKILFGGDGGDDDEDISENAIVKFANRFLKTSDKLDGDKFFIEEHGVKLATPLFLCLICVEFSDIVFAMDSVPAVFGVTSDPLIVFSSNIFAIASLRSVFGILSKAIADLVYLEKAVGVVLGFIAVKMAAETFGYELISPLQSLIVVVVLIVSGIVASLMQTEKEPVEVMG